jgi:hypothetical protein
LRQPAGRVVLGMSWGRGESGGDKLNGGCADFADKRDCDLPASTDPKRNKSLL